MARWRAVVLAALLGGAALIVGPAHGQGVERIETAALVASPSDVVALAGGTLLVADTGGGRIARVDAAGNVTTAAIGLNAPRGVSATADGGFLVADTGNDRIGRYAANGDGLGFTGAEAFLRPGGVAALPDGGYLVADTGYHRIRRVSATGEITTIAGVGKAGFGGDGGPAAVASLDSPARVAVLPGGGYLIADTGNQRIRRVSAAGIISTVAGSTGTPGFGGDGGPATAARLNRPEGVAVRADGGLLIADTGNQRVRAVDPAGVIRTLAGTGVGGGSGDGGPSTAAELNEPRAVATLAGSETVWIADSAGGSVRRLVAAAAPTPTPTPTGPATPLPAPTASDPPPGVSPPVLGRRAVVGTVAGVVTVRLPGRNRFATLTAATNLPLGTELDTRRGTVAVYFRTDRAGRTAVAIASGGRVVLRQGVVPDRGQRPGILALSGPLRGCPTRRAGERAAVAAAKGDGQRRIRVRAKGRIKTRGRYGSAIVRGTAWTTIDRCGGAARPGTLVTVGEGVVAVRDFARRTTIRVPAGRRYFAAAG